MLSTILNPHHLGSLFNAPLPLLSPPYLTLLPSSVAHLHLFLLSSARGQQSLFLHTASLFLFLPYAATQPSLFRVFPISSSSHFHSQCHNCLRPFFYNNQPVACTTTQPIQSLVHTFFFILFSTFLPLFHSSSTTSLSVFSPIRLSGKLFAHILIPVFIV